MLVGTAIFVASTAIMLCLTFALWLLNYALDGVDLITWLEEGAWKIPAFGGVVVVAAVVLSAFKRDADWQALARRCTKQPKLLRKLDAYTWVAGLAEVGESIYPIAVVGTEHGLLLRRPWQKPLFLAWESVSEIRVDWATHAGKVADLYLPNYDAPSFVLAIPWSEDLAWWVPDRLEVWNRGEKAVVD